MARIACPSCRYEFEYLEDLASGRLSCPACGTRLKGREPAQQRPAALGEIRLPRPLGDPLRLFRHFLSVIILLQLLYVAIALFNVMRAGSRSESDALVLNLALFLC